MGQSILKWNTAVVSDHALALTKRGRKAKPIDVASSHIIGNPHEFHGLANWVLRFEDSAGKVVDLSWAWAANRSKLGHLFLRTLYELTALGGPVRSIHTARTWHNSAKTFFLWLNEIDVDLQIGVQRPLAMWMFIAYKSHIDERVANKSIKSIVGYHRKRVITRIIQHIHSKHPEELEGEWYSTVFLLDQKVDDAESRLPYSVKEAGRILDAISMFLRSHLDKDRVTSTWPEQWQLDSLRERMLITALGLTLGIEPECITGLQVENITEVRNKVRLRYRKSRAPSHPHRVKQADAIDWGETIVPSDTFKTAGGLLAYAKRLAVARGVTQGALWTKSYEQNEFETLSRYLCKYYNLKGDDGKKLRIVRARLRTTWKTTRLLKSNGNLSLTTDDHTKDVGAKHYLENKALIPVYEQTVVNAARAALAHALESNIKVVDIPEDAPAEAVAAAAKKINEPPEQVRQALSGATDAWLASCKNFYNSPWDAPGDPCSKSFWACFECPNALVTRRVLPRILRYLDHITEQRRGIAEADWTKKFSLAYAQITEVILRPFPRV